MTQPSTSLLGARLRALRIEVGATQKDVADALGLGVSSISNYEKGAPLPDPRLAGFVDFVLSHRRADDVPREDARARLLHELRGLVDESAAELGGDLWRFSDTEPVVVVCGQLDDMTHPYSKAQDPNFTDLLTYADLDALIELWGHLRTRNPESLVRFVRSDRLTAADSYSSHLVILGGPGLNEGLQQVLDGTGLPITQREHPQVENGEVFYVEGADPELPRFSGRRLTGDVGLFARLVNPYNSARTLTWCSGIFSRGVLGAVRMLTDTGFADRNGSYLAERFGTAEQFAILARVPVVFGTTITPDLHNPKPRLYEWPPAEQPGEARPTGDAREGSR